jgi:ATP-dependent protease ClpP protease subunit
MRRIIIALSVVLSVAANHIARGESANVTGGVSCGENGLGGFTVQIVGEIDSTTVDKVGKLFDELHGIEANGGATNKVARPGSSVKCHVYGVGYEINSPGGSVSSAIAIGRMFRKENAHIQVDRNSACISACVLILVGAVDRQVSGIVGIHRPYLDTTPQQQITANQVKYAYRGMLQEIHLYLREMNVSEQLADDMLATEPERVHVLTDAELKSYGLSGIDPAEQQRRAIENEARDVQEANQLGLDRREYTRRKSLGVQSCVYNPSTGEIMAGGEMLDCRRRILTTGH